MRWYEGWNAAALQEQYRPVTLTMNRRRAESLLRILETYSATLQQSRAEGRITPCQGIQLEIDAQELAGRVRETLAAGGAPR